jgi:hypothetical protein
MSRSATCGPAARAFCKRVCINDRRADIDRRPSRTGCAPTVKTGVPQAGETPKTTAMCRAAARAACFGSSGPLCGGEGWTIRPAGGSAGRRSLFAGAGAPSKSPAAPHGLAGLQAQTAPSGGALLFGYFLLGKQEKVTRPPAGGRKPAAGEQAGDKASEKNRGQIGPSPQPPPRRGEGAKARTQSEARGTRARSR